MTTPLLRLDHLSKSYDGVLALNRVSLAVQPGMIKGVIGPNGAGKTTIFHLISGMEEPTSGQILFAGMDITGKAAHEIAALGIGRTFQTIQTWGTMTVVENILAGMHTRIRGNFFSCGLRLPWISKGEKAALKEAKGILESLGLLGRWKWPALQLSFGQQKMLELGRAMAMQPRLLLLDEPAAGLTPVEVKNLAATIRQLKAQGITIVVVEHHQGMVMEIADEIAVLHNGELICDDTPAAVKKDRRVIEAYLVGGGGGGGKSA
jgi:ABC-type branched-subunit amino acid transport system ATPase component